MATRAILGLVTFALVAPAPHSSAQHLPESVLRLRPGATVRVQTRSFGSRDGQLLRATRDTLLLLAQETEVVVATHDLEGLWQRGRATRTGALAGGLLGAAATGIFAGVLCGGVSGTCTSRGGAVASGAAVGALGGALIGGVVGSAIPKWHRRYP